MIKINLGKEYSFSSRNSEKVEIKKIFDKLFVYTSKEPINRINTKLFIKDFEEIVQEFECPICLQFPLEPIQCSKCLKIFCKQCQINNKCPMCRELFVQKDIDRILKNIMDKLLLRCGNCEKYNIVLKISKVKVSEYINHLKKCDYSDYQCLTCKKIISHSKKDCLEHAHFCGYSDSSCCYCLKSLKLYLKKEHETKCGEELVECEFCQTKLERKKIENHKKNLCLMRIVKCKDCFEQYKYKDFDNHLKEECKDNQIRYWKKKFEEAKQVLEEDFKFTYDEENLKKRKTFERQNTETNLFTNLKLDFQPNNTVRSRERKPLNPFLDSSIIKEKDISYIYGLFEKKDFINFSLVYKMSRDGEILFHKFCDNIGPTISFFKIRRKLRFNKVSDSFNRYGGYTSVSWDKSGEFKKDDTAFIFSLTKKIKFMTKEPYYSIYCSTYYGPSFGFQKFSPALWNKGKYGGYSASDTFGDSQRECTCGTDEFIIEELEVYKVNFEDL